jgi:hypothetical protein
MNRRQFLLSSIAVTLAVVLHSSAVQHHEHELWPTGIQDVWLRGTYAGWPAPGVPVMP